MVVVRVKRLDAYKALRVSACITVSTMQMAVIVIVRWDTNIHHTKLWEG